MPIDIYSMRLSPPCRAVLMTAKQLNIDLNVKTLDLSQGEQMTPEFLKINPAHNVPTIVDDGFTLWESRAIMAYLVNQYAPNSSLYPKDPKKRAIVDRLLNFDMSLGGTQREAVMMKLFTGVEPTDDKVIAHKNNLKLLNQLIGDNKYLTGAELTIADLSILATTCLVIDFVDYDVSEFPNFKRWYSGLKEELPYYKEINVFDKDYILGYMEKVKARIAAVGPNK